MTITHEMIHDTRVIPLDRRPHISPSIQQYLGNARGHWEGNYGLRNVLSAGRAVSRACNWFLRRA